MADGNRSRPHRDGHKPMIAGADMQARFKRAWEAGVPSRAMCERFGLSKGALTMTAQRLGLKPRARAVSNEGG